MECSCSFRNYIRALNTSTLTDASPTADVSLRSSNSSSLAGTTYREEGEQQCVADLCGSVTQDAPLGGSTLVSSHLRVFATEVAVHGGAGGHLRPTEVARLGFHLLVSQMDVLLQHVLGQVLLIACCACPCLPHWGEKTGFVSPDVNGNIHVTEVSANWFLFCRRLHLARVCEGPGNGLIVSWGSRLCESACAFPELSSRWRSFHTART